MADVGVLNLQIRDNSEEAVGGLTKLTDVLTRIKEAVAGGLKLSPIANGIEKIGKVVNESISGSTIVKIGQIADELAKLKGLGNVNIKINSSSADSIRDSVKATQEMMTGINNGFAEADQRIVEAKNDALDFGSALQQFDPSKLPLSSLGKTLDEASSNVQQDIGMVKKSFETLGYMGVFDNMANSVQDAGQAVNAIIPYHENLENTWERICQRMDDAKQVAAEAVQTPPAGGIAVYNTIEEAAKSLGITVDEANKRIQESYQWAMGNGKPITVFDTLEEAAQSMGISMDEARKRVGQIVEEVNGKGASGSTIFDKIGEKSTTSGALVDLLKEKIEILREEVRTGTTQNGNILSEKTIINDQIQIQKLTEQVERLQEKMNMGARSTGTGWVEGLGDWSKIDLMTMKLDGMKQSLAMDIDQNKLDAQAVADRMMRIQELTDRIEQLKHAESGAETETKNLRDRLAELGHAAQETRIGKLISKFAQIAKYRFLRSVLKHITSGFSEGVQNVYEYSKAIGSSFAPAMDSAATAIQQVKNSVGAAAAPAIQALIPLLQTVANWFITLVNYANQFFALLAGQATWTRALPASANAFDKQKKAAKGAGAAIKDLMADWDELNIIQSNSGGGGGGATSAAEDYLAMFEEVGKFDNKLKSIVDSINHQFGDIMGLVKRIGVIIAGWKIAGALSGVLATLGGLIAAGGIIDLVFNITTMLDDQYFKTGDIGWVVGDVLQTALGAYLANKVVSKVLSEGAGKVAAGVTLTLSAVADIIALAGNTDVSALSTEGIITAIKSGLKLGGGFMLFATAAGVPTAEAIVAAGGVASIGIGAVIAIKAVAEAAQTGDITLETVKSGVAGAVAAGLGVTVFEMIGGAAFGAALATGGVAALAIGAGFAVALGIVAMIDGTKVEWGEITLTDEQVQTFVNTKMFSVSVPVTVKIIDDSLKDISADKESIETGITNALGTLNVIRLGVAKDDDYTTLAKEILGESMDGSGGVVGAVTKYIEDAEKMGKLTLKFTPSLVGTDATDASEWFTNYTTGWDKVETFVKQKGAEIGKLLTTEEGRKIIESTPEVLNALMQQVSEVTSAVTGAQISSEAFANMKVSLDDLDESSFNKAISVYTDYLEQLRGKVKELVIQQYTSQGELVAALIASGADPNQDPLKSAIAEYEYMGQHINEAISKSVEEYSRPGAQEMVKFMQQHYMKALSGFSLDLDELGYLSGIRNGAFDMDIMNELLTSWLSFNDRGLAETLQGTGIYAWNVLGEDVKEKIRIAMEAAFGDKETDELIKEWESQISPQNEADTIAKPYEEGAERIKNAFDSVAGLKLPEFTTGVDGTGIGVNVSAGTLVRAAALLNGAASGGVFAPVGGTGNTADTQQVTGSVSKAGSEVVGAINALGESIARELQKQAKRPINVTVRPSSGWGMFNARSGEAYNTVTGG